jgi:hypothetical protein
MRFVFNIPSDSENPEATINYLKERYKYKDQVKVEITNGYVEERKKIKKENVEKDNEIYSFIFEEYPVEDKVGKFIEIVYHNTIPTSHIADYMYKTLGEILGGEY